MALELSDSDPLIDRPTRYTDSVGYLSVCLFNSEWYDIDQKYRSDNVETV